MGGLEAVEYLRDALPNVVIVVYTGADGLAESVRNSGADLYAVKGSDPARVLEAAARHALDRRPCS